MENLTIKEIPFGSKEYENVLTLRDKILRKPLNLTFNKEDLALEKNQDIYAAYLDDQLVGCALIKPYNNGKVRMRQVAVDNDLQSKGIGSKLTEYIEEVYTKNGTKEIILHSRKTALPFYQKLGYTVISQQFEEIGLPHYKMHKVLSEE